jgi:N-acetylmuramoyl-L-alanine amidase
VACAFAVYTVVNATLLSSDEPAATSSETKSATTSKTRTVSERSSSGKKQKTRRRRAYTVKSGDTLSSIAVKTGVSLERIQELNPKLDSNSLQTGQRVKLSP